MAGLLTPLPDGRPEVRSFAVNKTRNKVSVYGMFYGTDSETVVLSRRPGKSAAGNYVHDMASTVTRSAT